MPTYSYACTECDNRFDAVQAFTDDALEECPQCSGRLRKLFGSVGVVFKGSGFYRNDSRQGSATTVPAAGSGADSKAAASGGETAKPASADGASDKTAAPAPVVTPAHKPAPAKSPPSAAAAS